MSASDLAAAAPPRRSAGRVRLALAGISAAAGTVPFPLWASLAGLLYAAGFDHLAYVLGLMAGVVLAGVWIAPKLQALGAESLTHALRLRFGPVTAGLGAIVLLLVTLLLLVADFTLIGALAEAWVEVPARTAILAALFIAVCSAVVLDPRWARAIAAVAFAAFAVVLWLLLAVLANQQGETLASALDYGRALGAVTALEETLLQRGEVDFETFGAHTATFLKLTRLDFAALVVAIALGAAAMPRVAGGLGRPRSVAASRVAGAWGALLAMAVVLAMPPLAIFAKLEVYRAFAAPTRLADAPAWIEAPSRAGLAHIHGTSLALVDEVARALDAGLTAPDAISDHLARDASHASLAARWAGLGDDVKAAIVDLAGASRAGASWRDYARRVLPVAASSAGNADEPLTQAALAIEPAGLLAALPALADGPPWLAMAFAGAVLFAAVAMLMLQAGTLSARFTLPASARAWLGSALMAAVAGIAAGGAIYGATAWGGIVALVVSALSLAAAGLFPVLAIGLAWKRTRGAAAAAAIIAGLSVALCYEVGTRFFPEAVSALWAPISRAVQPASGEPDAFTEAAQGEAESEADVQPGASHAASPLPSVVFAVPAGILTLVLVSIVAGALPHTRVGRPQP